MDEAEGVRRVFYAQKDGNAWCIMEMSKAQDG